MNQTIFTNNNCSNPTNRNYSGVYEYDDKCLWTISEIPFTSYVPPANEYDDKIGNWEFNSCAALTAAASAFTTIARKSLTKLILYIQMMMMCASSTSHVKTEHFHYAWYGFLQAIVFTVESRRRAFKLCDVAHCLPWHHLWQWFQELGILNRQLMLPSVRSLEINEFIDENKICPIQMQT